MKQALPVFLVVGSLGLAGCAGLSPSPQPPASAPVAQTESSPPAAESEIPPQLLYQLLVGEVAAQRGKMGEAIANYLAAAEASDDPRIAARAARIALYAKQLMPALEAATLWAKRAPSDPEAHRLLASLLLAFDREAEAVTEFQVFLSLSAQRPDRGFRQVAGQLSRARDQAAALRVMQRLLAVHESEPNAWYAQAWLAAQFNQVDEAMTALDRAQALKPDWPQAVVLRARLLGQQGKKEGALAYLEAQLKGPLAEVPEVRLSYARVLTDLNRLDEALHEFDRLAERFPDNAEIRYSAGIVALNLKRYDEAKTHLEHVLALGQRVLEANYYLGRLYELQGDAQQALRHYLSVRHGPLYLNAQSRAANLLAKEGDLQQARKLLHSLRTQNDQERRQVDLIEAELLRNAGELQMAFDFLSEKLAGQPDDTELRYARALIAERLDKLDVAEQDLRAIIAREPDNAQALNALGYTLADRTERHEEALALVRRAFELKPDDPAIIDSMGWVEYRLGHFTAAEKYLQRALELQPDAEIAAHLGAVLWAKGDRQAAIALWEKYLQQFPHDPALLKVMQQHGL